MTKEPVILEDEHFDRIEEVVDVLADGCGVAAPDDELREEFQEIRTELSEARV